MKVGNTVKINAIFDLEEKEPVYLTGTVKRLYEDDEWFDLEVSVTLTSKHGNPYKGKKTYLVHKSWIVPHELIVSSAP